MWLVASLLCTALIAGCGSSSSSSTTTSTSTPPAPAAASGAASSNPNVQQAVALCKQEIQAEAKSIPAASKAKLEAICQKAASGDTAAVKQVAREVCEEVINGSAVPGGPAKEQALAACKAK